MNTTVDHAGAIAAIAFALETDDGLAFLRCWNEGDIDAIRREWPEAPEEVFIGADSGYQTDREPAGLFFRNRKPNTRVIRCTQSVDDFPSQMLVGDGSGAPSAVKDSRVLSLAGLRTVAIRATSESEFAEQVDRALRSYPDCVVFRELPSTKNALRKLVESGLSVLLRPSLTDSQKETSSP